MTQGRDARQIIAHTATLICALVVATASATPGQAQVLDPLEAVQGYMTADPIDPTNLGLATPDGRFAILPLQGCDWLTDGQTVEVYPNYYLPPALGLSGPDGTQPSCIVQVQGRRSSVPCFEDDSGVCDEALEHGQN